MKNTETTPAMITTDLTVNKTYKLFINGAFPRTESGRYKSLKNTKGQFVANICISSRKDFRNAVVAARNAQQSWQDRTAYNKSQIIYRIAEMLDQRRLEFIKEMTALGYSSKSAEAEINAAVDALVYYAGWCDKYIQVFSSVNPVASSHFNFSIPEPMGVVAVMAPNSSAVLGLVQAVIPAICGGNTAVVLASETYPTSAVTFGEVLATSDVPAGIINILTGNRNELNKHFASHMDVNALVVWDEDENASAKQMGTIGAENVKRIKYYKSETLTQTNPYLILDLQEIKTTWHPIENIKGSKAGY